MRSFAVLLHVAPLLVLVTAEPLYCTPPSKVDQDNNRVNIDKSNSCASSGDCVNACGTFIQSTACTGSTFDAGQVTDLQIALYDQMAKDGQFEYSTSGAWTVSFYLGTTAVPNRNVANELDAALSDFSNKGDDAFLPQDIYLQWTDASNPDVVQRIQATRQC